MKEWKQPTLIALHSTTITSGKATGFAEQCKCQYLQPDGDGFYYLSSSMWFAGPYYGSLILNGENLGCRNTYTTVWQHGTQAGTDTVSFIGIPCS